MCDFILKEKTNFPLKSKIGWQLYGVFVEFPQTVAACIPPHRGGITDIRLGHSPQGWNAGINLRMTKSDYLS